jgi:hypothetical protein
MAGKNHSKVQLESNSPVYAANPVYFTATITDTPPFTCTWDFGDESALLTETVPSVTFTMSYTYLEPGTYSATLYVITPSQNTILSETTLVEVASPFLGITITHSGEPEVSQPVVFTATMAGGKAPYAYTWDFGDESPPQSGVAADSEFTTSHHYALVGPFTLTLEAADDLGTTLSETILVEVGCQPLGVILTGTRHAQAGEPVLFTATVAGGEVPYAYSWDYGDESPIETGISSEGPIRGEHSYGAGVYTVTFLATDARGCSTPPATLTVEITNTRNYLPFIVKDYTPPIPVPPQPIVNGGFEEGDLEGWNSGGELPASVVSSLWSGNVYSGTDVALLGDPAYGDGGSGGVPVGSGWLSQEFTIPEGYTGTLSLAYRMQGYDGLDNDRFRACIVNVATTESDCFVEVSFEDFAGTFKDTGWQVATVDLPPDWQTVRISLEHSNEIDGYWNTWTYADEVQVSLAR